VMYAAGNNRNPEVITTLIKAGANVNAKDKNGGTPLIMAAGNQNQKRGVIITTLLNAGADAKARDKEGKTALDYAKENKKLKGTDALEKLNEASFE
jgi:ankyrin repeat protein